MLQQTDYKFVCLIHCIPVVRRHVYVQRSKETRQVRLCTQVHNAPTAVQQSDNDKTLLGSLLRRQTTEFIARWTECFNTAAWRAGMIDIWGQTVYLISDYRYRPTNNKTDISEGNTLHGNSSVGIRTRYGLDSPGIESRWGRDFPHPPRRAMGPTQLPIKWIPGVFPEGKAAGIWRSPPPPTSAKVKERVELYVYSPFRPSWPVLGRTLPSRFYSLHRTDVIK